MCGIKFITILFLRAKKTNSVRKFIRCSISFCDTHKEMTPKSLNVNELPPTMKLTFLRRHRAQSVDIGLYWNHYNCSALLSEKIIAFVFCSMQSDSSKLPETAISSDSFRSSK